MKEKNEIWLIGAGPMGVDYAKVLKELDQNFITITRGKKKALEFKQATGLDPVVSGVEDHIKEHNYIPKFVINAVGIDKLAEVTETLLKAGIKNILLEKPGVAYAQ